MPQFLLTGAEAPEFRALDSFTQGYIEALFFTECATDVTRKEWRVGTGETGPDHGASLPSDVSFSDIATDTLERIKADCEAFTATPAFLAFANWRDNDDSENTSPADDEQAGRDFWYTRNGHGVGFWDRPASYYGPHQEVLDKACGHGTAFGTTDAYFGDDGKVYLS